MSSEGMHPEEIKAEIRKRGHNLTDLSLEWGYSPTAISKALKMPIPSIEPLISKLIEVPLHKIWPDRYDRENLRIYPIRNRKKRSPKTGTSHCKK